MIEPSRFAGLECVTVWNLPEVNYAALEFVVVLTSNIEGFAQRGFCSAADF
jgi:hypothetical protein